MNEPSDMDDTMDTNSEGVTLSGKSPNGNLEIREGIIHNPKIYLNIAGNILYESPADKFYNTVDIKSDNARKSTNSKDIDLINFDQSSARLSVGSYLNGVSDSESCSNSPQLNETFNQIIGVVQPVNKHLKVKTADLLSVSGIGGRYSIASENQSINNDSLNDSKVNFEDANDYYTVEEIVTQESSNTCVSTVQVEHTNGFHSDADNQDSVTELFTTKTDTIENLIPAESTEELDKTTFEEAANISNLENNINNNITQNVTAELSDFVENINTDLIENIHEKIIVENHSLNETDSSRNLNETIFFENPRLNTTNLDVNIHNEIIVENHSLNTTFNHTKQHNLLDNDIEIKGESEKTETNDDGSIIYVSDVDLTGEFEFEQLSPASPRPPIAEDPVKEEYLSDNLNIQENTEDLASTLSPKDHNCNFKMTDLVEKLNQQQAEISDLKLKLNAAQQHTASLELQIRQNEEIVIKTQAEALSSEQNYLQEVKQLKEKLNENSKIIEKDRIRELEEQVKDCKAREAKLLAEISQITKDDVNYQKIMEQYEINLKSRIVESKKLEEENETIRTHLTNLEMAFSDVHSKYEKTKAALQGVKANEETLLSDLEVAQSTNLQHEERYESLKAHARTQIEKSNKEIHAMRELHEMEVNKLKAFTRRLEIKLSSLELSLQQKTEECEQLSALCDEVTGKQV